MFQEAMVQNIPVPSIFLTGYEVPSTALHVTELTHTCLENTVKTNDQKSNHKETWA